MSISILLALDRIHIALECLLMLTLGIWLVVVVGFYRILKELRREK